MSENTPLAAERVFLYPGDPNATGIINYDVNEHKDEFKQLDFVNSSDFVDSLESDITLDDRSLLEVSDGSQFDVPDYQRNYSWKEGQHEEMWETVRQVLQLKIKANERPSDTFFGSVYVAKSSQEDEYEIIDGQQRLATVGIILKNIRDHLTQRKEEISGDLRSYAEHIGDKYIDELLYRQSGFNEIPFVSLNEHDDPWFKLLFKDAPSRAEAVRDLDTCDGRQKRAYRLKNILKNKLEIDKEHWEDFDESDLNDFKYYGEAHKRLIEADEFYDKKIEELLSQGRYSDPEQEVRLLINITQYITRSLRVCRCLFETDDRELRVEVFQSLNDRGIELSKMDKVRARIVGRFQGAEDEQEMIGLWENVIEMFAADDNAVADFLAHYLAATEPEFDKVTKAREDMLEAFRLKDVQSEKIKSRLSSAGEARSFLEKLEEYAQRYLEITDASLRDDVSGMDQDTREHAEAILQRLDGLGTKSWRPFVMYVYQAITETPQQGEFFHEVLKTVENIMFRFVVSPHQATVIDTTFPVATQEFRKLEQSDEQFDAERLTEILLDNIDESATKMFDEEFARELVSTRGWKNNQVKLLLMKIVDEDLQGRNESGIKNSSLSHNTEEVTVEHILPRSFLHEGDENPYAWLDFFFTDGTEEKLTETRKTLRESGASGEAREKPEAVERIIEDIRNFFVQDIGNTILLEDGLNKSVQNALFGDKLRAYHTEHADDMETIANEYLTDEGEIDPEELRNLKQAERSQNGDERPDIVRKFDKWWTWRRSMDRKSQIVEAIIDSLSFPTKPAEFDSVEGDIQELVENEQETRFTLVS